MFLGDVHPSLPQFGELITSGHMTISACWAEGDDGQPLCPVDLKTNKEK